MADANRLKKGDEVIVKFPTDDGFIDHCAVVDRSSERGLHVVFASGFRYQVPHGEGRYRKNPNV
jgi:hypothetical protein